MPQVPDKAANDYVNAVSAEAALGSALPAG
jgi:hypothetical protein